VLDDGSTVAGAGFGQHNWGTIRSAARTDWVVTSRSQRVRGPYRGPRDGHHRFLPGRAPPRGRPREIARARVDTGREHRASFRLLIASHGRGAGLDDELDCLVAGYRAHHLGCGAHVFTDDPGGPVAEVVEGLGDDVVDGCGTR
jgi:hypothetical protein